MAGDDRVSRNRAIFVFDAAMLLAFCAVESVRLGGIAFHEWLGITFIAVFVAHLLLSWNWISAQTRHLMLRVSRERIGYFLNFALFVMTVIAIFTGIMISEAALPAMGINIRGNAFWHEIHNFSSNLMMLLVGLHVALNWDWSLKTIRQFSRKEPAAAVVQERVP
jgi:hypothetical protein